ncbi:MAG: hypothetical protein IKC64_05595 [Clostridia bacterium]|nr:hypothetical protein [Clostridia bacterium]
MRNKRLIVLLSIFVAITLIVVFSSVTFSVKQVYGYCYNDEDPTLCQTVSSRENVGDVVGKSIFMVSESKIKASIEKKNPDVKVINIEKKFPNLVYVNFVKIFPYLVYETQDSALLISNDSKILSTTAKETTYLNQVKLITDTAPNSTEIGQALYEQNTDEKEIIAQIMDVMQRIDLHSHVVDMFEFIDITNTCKNGLTYIKTRSGVYIELQNGKDDIVGKLTMAISVYVSDQTQYMTSGTIIVPSAGRAQYSKDNRYENGVA